MQHSNVQNYQIFQRNADGYAPICYHGVQTPAIEENQRILARIVRETDNLELIPWTTCMTQTKDGGTAWSLDVNVPEGGLYRFEAQVMPITTSPEWGTRIDCAYHVGVGDVYVMAGQSNMTGYARDFAYDPPTLGVHAFTRQGNWALAVHPLGDSIDSPYGYSENCSGTSPALSFARRLHEELNIPIGLVPAAIGGTALAEWDPEQDGGCYKRMCAFLADAGAFKGMIWLQGCSDTAEAARAESYLDNFKRILGLWRKQFGHFPMITAQLNRWVALNDGHLDREWGLVVEAQRQAAMTIPDVYLVATLDLSGTDGIHNGSGANVVIGERMAMVTLKNLYGKMGLDTPNVTRVERVANADNVVRVWLTPGFRVRAMDNVAFGMNIEDENGLIDCTTCVPEKDYLTVTAARPIGKNAAFHYAWRSQPPVFAARDCCGVPLPACYNVPIE